MAPSYKFDEFMSNCIEGISRVVVFAMQTARDDFNLKTQKQALEFIGNDGLERPYFLNTKKWEKNPDPEKIMVDAYGFYTGSKHGYIAFLFQPKTKKWIIKSLKINSEPDTRNKAFVEALSKLQDKKQEEDL